MTKEEFRNKCRRVIVKDKKPFLLAPKGLSGLQLNESKQLPERLQFLKDLKSNN